jgi:hypothetical protein
VRVGGWVQARGKGVCSRALKHARVCAHGIRGVVKAHHHGKQPGCKPIVTSEMDDPARTCIEICHCVLVVKVQQF